MKQHALADASLIRKISLTIFFFALLSINKKKKKKNLLCPVAFQLWLHRFSLAVFLQVEPILDMQIIII